jgi:histidinol-phosphate aminotransferase
MYYVDPNIKNTLRTPISQGRKGYLRLDMNENPEGLPQDFFDKVIKTVTPEYLATYPEDGNFIHKYAHYLGLQDEQISPTDGSVVAIQYLLKVFGEPGKDVVVVTPSFMMYNVNCQLLGLHCISVPYEKDFTFKIENILSKITDDTRMVILVNPNMPVGNVYSEKEIRAVLQKAQTHHAVVVADEAYFYFYDKSTVKLLTEFDNLIILRTFSKLLSIPSLRLGIMISNPTFIKYLNNWKSHFTVNGMALKFGEAILDQADTLIPELEKRAFEGREYLKKELKILGYQTLPSSGNFVCVKPLHTTSKEIIERMKEKKILLYLCSGDLQDYFRITTASKPLMEQVIKALQEVDK